MKVRILLTTCLLCGLSITLLCADAQPTDYLLTVATEPIKGLPWIVSNSTFTKKLEGGASVWLASGTYSLSVPSNVTIQYDGYADEVWVFSSWSDGLAQPSRTVELTANLALTARYVEQATPPPPPPPPTQKYFVASVDPKTHEDYGLTYPATYVFSIPSKTGLAAYKKYAGAEDWVRVPERFEGELFNGVEAARFSYGDGKAYISVAFSSYSDQIYIRIADVNESEVATSFLGISEFYDNRKCAVTVTVDDVQSANLVWGGDEKYMQAAKAFSDAQVWWTAGLVTSYCYDWSIYQAGINMGYVEAASHSRTHPDGAASFTNYDGEIDGSKQDIINNLDLPFKKGGKEYVWAWIEPSGYSDEIVRQKLGQYKYLVSRAVTAETYPTPWASWDSVNNHYSRTSSGLFMDIHSLSELNRAFDQVHLLGGIYQMWTHVGKNDWLPGGKGYEHIQYLKGHADVWYVSFGLMYVYHHTQKVVSVSLGDSAPGTIVQEATYIIYWARTFLPTDLNRDGTVNIIDITIAAASYNSRPVDSNWKLIADLDKNGIIDIVDITMIAKDYGKIVWLF